MSSEGCGGGIEANGDQCHAWISAIPNLRPPPPLELAVRLRKQRADPALFITATLNRWELIYRLCVSLAQACNDQ